MDICFTETPNKPINLSGEIIAFGVLKFLESTVHDLEVNISCKLPVFYLVLCYVASFSFYLHLWEMKHFYDDAVNIDGSAATKMSYLEAGKHRLYGD